MTLVAFLIAVTIAVDGDYDAAASNLRAVARGIGCETPVIERLAKEGEPTVRIMATCRTVTPDEGDKQ
jgi:hypothetical protein